MLPLAVAFYAEDGFGTGEHALCSNLSVLLASPARDQGCRRLELVIAPNDRDVGQLFDYYIAHGFQDESRRLIGRPL